MAMYRTTPSTNNLEAMGQKGNLLICDLWKSGIDSVHNMRVVNTDAKSNSSKSPEKTEQVKNKMYLEECLQQCQLFRHSSPPLMGYWVWRQRLPRK